MVHTKTEMGGGAVLCTRRPPQYGIVRGLTVPMKLITTNLLFASVHTMCALRTSAGGRVGYSNLSAKSCRFSDLHFPAP